jgi:hypothetical protein
VSLCGSTDGYPNAPSESKQPCLGSILVTIAQGVDCGRWWLFNATTGDLEAVGGSCAGTTDPGCTGALSGFSFPYQCFQDNGWSQWVELCPDASADASTITDATAGAAD